MSNDKSKNCELIYSGWSTPENWGVWGIGEKHELQIPIAENIESDLKLTINAMTFNRQRDVAVFINGYKIGNLLISPGMAKSYTMQVDKISLSDADEMDIVFVLDGKSLSPQELGISVDNRKLGLGLVSLQIEKITERNDQN